VWWGPSRPYVRPPYVTWVNMEQRWNGTGKGKRKGSEKACTSVTCSHVAHILTRARTRAFAATSLRPTAWAVAGQVLFFSWLIPREVRATGAEEWVSLLLTLSFYECLQLRFQKSVGLFRVFLSIYVFACRVSRKAGQVSIKFHIGNSTDSHSILLQIVKISFTLYRNFLVLQT
jgi:hypothetical protein